MAESTPLQLYVAALIFTPNDSVVRRCFSCLLPTWIVQAPHVQDSWSSEIMTITGGRLCQRSIFSPTGDSILGHWSSSLPGEKKSTVKLLDSSTGAERAVFTYDSHIREMTLHPKGASALISLWTPQVLLQDLVTGEQSILHIHNMEAPGTMAFASDGARVAAAAPDGVAWVYNLQNDQLHVQDLASSAKHSRERPNRKVAFSKDGTVVVMATYSAFTEMVFVQHWRLRCGPDQECPPIYIPAKPGQRLLWLQLSPHGNLVVPLWENDTTIQIRDTMTGAANAIINLSTMLEPQRGLSQWTAVATVSPKEDIVAVWLQDGVVGLWDATTGASVRSYWHGSGPTPFITMPEDCSKLMATTPGGLLLHDLPADEGDRTHVDVVHTHGPHRRTLVPAELQFISDSEMIKVNGDGMLETYNIPTATVTDRRPRDKRQVGGFTVRTSPRFGTSARDDYKRDLDVWDSFARRKLHECHPHDNDKALISWALSHDRSLVALEFSGHIVVRDTASGSIRASLTLSSEPRRILDVCFEPNNTALLLWKKNPHEVLESGYYRLPNLTLWIFNTGRAFHWLGTGGAAYFIPDSTKFVKIHNHDLELIDMSSAHVTRLDSSPEDNDPYPQLAVSPDGGTIVRAEEEQIDVWDTVTATRIRSIHDGRHQDLTPAFEMAVSDSRILARVGPANGKNNSRVTRICVWNLVSGEQLGELDLPWLPSEISDISFSKDQTYLETNFGRLPLPPLASDQDDDDQEKATDALRQCFFVTDEWIMQGLEKLIWLPLDYRSSNVAVRNGIVALHLKPDVVRFIGVDLDRTPTKKS